MADAEVLPRLVASIAAFIVFSVASGLAQWYVATLHISPTTSAGQASLVFRVAMPVDIDLASMLYLSIMKVKSLKRSPFGDGARCRRPLSRSTRATCGSSRREPEALQTKPQHDQYLRPLEATQQVVIDLQRIITGHIVTTATAALTGRPGGEVLVQALPAAGDSAEEDKGARPKRSGTGPITAQFETLDASQARDKRGCQ